MRICLRCDKPLTQAPREKDREWLNRKYCNVQCFRWRKIEPADVRAIRQSPKLLRELAAEYAVTISTCARIKARKSWVWLED